MFVFLVGARDGQMFVDPYLSKVMKYVLKMKFIGSSKTIPQTKALATKPGNLSLILGTCMVKEEK